MAPIELVGFARCERQRYIRLRRLPRVLPAPDPGVAANGIIAAVIAQRLQLLEQPDQRQPLARRAAGVPRQEAIQLSLPMPELRTRLNLPLICKRCLPERSTLRTVLRETFRSRAISLI